MRKIGQIAETLLDGLREKARRRKIVSAVVDAHEVGEASIRERHGTVKGGTAAPSMNSAAAPSAGVHAGAASSGIHVKKMN